jgi:hypothetical protein
MDYARYNYIAQPGDSGVKLTPPEIGVYDKFLVKWTYRYLPEFTDEWSERPVVESWVDAVAGDPVYRYGRQQSGVRYDPSAMSEDLGDDPIRAGDYGIANLKYILPNLAGWIADDPDYRHRETLYNSLTEQYGYYIRNVVTNIGGIRLYQVKEGTQGEGIVPVPREIQKASLRWVMDRYRDMEWLDAPALRRKFDLDAGGAPQTRSRVAEAFKGQIENVVLSSSFAGSPYTVHEYLDDLYNETWRHLHPRRIPTNAEKILQKTMVAMFCEPLAAMTAGGSSESDIAARERMAAAPGIDDIIAYRLDESGVVERYTGLLRDYESRHGHGSVASLLWNRAGDGDTRFGPGGMGLQSSADVSSIDDSAEYLIELALRSRTRLEQAVRRSRGASQAHYMSLLMQVNAALKDKL